MALPAGSKHVRQKRLMLTVEDDVAVEELTHRIAAALGTPLKFSHLLRACIHIMRHAEREILQEAKRSPLNRPPNECQDALADFEARFARTLLVAFKKSGFMRKP
jgi:hypothetical protein